MSAPNDMQNFMEESSQRIIQLQQNKVKECFDQSNNSIDDFTDCFRPYLQRMEEIEKPIQVSVLYSQLHFQKCMTDKNDQDYCTNSTMNVLKNRINHILGNL